jgi:hypothetical protein
VDGLAGGVGRMISFAVATARGKSAPAGGAETPRFPAIVSIATRSRFGDNFER